MPSSMSTVRCVGLPSSSMLSEPRRSGIVPSSTTVTPGAATRCPIRFENADVSLRLKSPSSPCPIASCSRIPGHPGPRTTVIVPAGAVERSRVAAALERGDGTLALLGDGAGRARRLGEGFEADVVGIGESRSLAGYRAHTDAAVDRERARLDDALLQAPRLDPRVLKIQVRIVDAMAVDIGEDPRELVELQRCRCQQKLRGL